MNVKQLDARAARILEELRGDVARRSLAVEDIEIAPRGGKFKAFQNGDFWGQDQEWMDFRLKVKVPADFTGAVRLRLNTGREGNWDAVNPQFVAWVNGRIEQAIDVNHTTLLLQKAKAGDTFDILLQGYAQPRGEKSMWPVMQMWLEDVHTELQQLIYDIDMPLQAVKLLPEGQRDREVTLETLSQAIDLLDLRQKHSPAFDASVKAARRFLKEQYYQKRDMLPAEAEAWCVGHTHIDVAWLWDLYQTRHKTVRSFATVLKLMELYPEYLFMSSQAALYNFVKEDQPELFERIRQAVKEGRWEVEGGMWVEADCNLAGGEALVRQFLHGQEFFRREFDKPSRILWLPDVFGYSAALPQILKLCGIDYFMTTKLSWSEFNKTPYDTFRWKGIDGTEVLTHFSPSRDYSVDASRGLPTPNFTTYNAMLDPNQIKGGWQRFQQKDIDRNYLVTYGYGDGGGGPTDWMLENQRRLQTPLPEVPRTRQSHSRTFFEALEKRVGGDPRLPKWSGELYLEYHRGTYTAVAKNKRNNRKIELLLREVELWCSYAAQLGLMDYPAAALHEVWQDVLTLQFHDILPGSSIKKVYDDSDIMYAKGFETLNALREGAIAALSARVEGDLKCFNPLGQVRDDIVCFEAPKAVTALRGPDGALHPVQFVEGKAYAFVRNLAPMTATPFTFHKGKVEAESIRADAQGFETPLLRGMFDDSMRIISLVDKREGRELAKAGEALNRIVCYENKPQAHDAWDISIFYDRRHFEVDGLTKVEVISCGPVLAKLRAHYAYSKSSLVQDIVIYHDLPRVDFETTVDWQEQQYMLKAHFPVDVFYNEATYDIQFGNLRRATHKNTSWDVARFEVCAHKWADVSEAGYGVSLLNDCKYGYSIDENSMALTLLKSSTHPNPVADQEVHHFTYSLLPHQGDWRQGGTVEQGYSLNVPVLTTTAKGQGSLPGFAAVQEPGVVLETVKQALNGQGTVVRLYETHGRRRTDVQLKLQGAAPKSAWVCNLLEAAGESVKIQEGVITFDLKPYEIKSFLLK